MKMSHTLNSLAVAGILTAGAFGPAPALQAAAQTTPQATKPTAAEGAPVNPDAAALADFKKRVDAYLALHRKVAKTTPPLKPTEDPAEITHAQESLATAIQAARADAKPGDIFTPEIRAAFRKVLRPELKGEAGKEAKEVLKDDAPTGVPLKVNTKYPDLATRPTVPAAVLKNLPPLPKEVEYRIIKTNLLLVDNKAGLIVDYIPNAVTE